MSITELCEAIGPDNILIQNVAKSADQMDYSKKRGGTVVRMFTDQIQSDDLISGEHKKVGLVIWFDLERYKAAINAYRLNAKTEDTK